MIQHYFLRAIENSQALSFFGVALQALYWRGFFLVVGIIFLLFAWYSTYLLFKKSTITPKKQKLTFNDVKISLLHAYEKGKGFLLQARYLVIWAGLQLLSWSFISFIFNAIPQDAITLTANDSNDINLLLGKWASFSLLIFMIAPYFITFSFGNKFVRNLGILTYIVGIWFILFGYLLQLGTLA